jgi:hypothetical protein
LELRGSDVSLKKLLNRPEATTYQALLDACRRRPTRVFAKVRLADVFDLNWTGISYDLHRFGLQAHFDFVVTDTGHMPLLAVEFDGPIHQDSAQAERDAKKDELAKWFGFDLIRIGYPDLDGLAARLETWFDERGIKASRPASESTPAPAAKAQPSAQVDPPVILPAPPPEAVKAVIEEPAPKLKPAPPPVPHIGDLEPPPFKPARRPTPQAGPGPSPSTPTGGRPAPGPSFPAWLLGVLAGLVALLVVALGLVALAALLSRPSPDRERPSGPVATTTGTPAIAKTTTAAAVVPPAGPPATGPQMGLLGALVSRKGWSKEQRDAEAEKVLGYQRSWGSLSKREASKLIDAWDDRKK